MFNKILIANRGEIAVRIIRTCKKMGIQTVAVFSDTDLRGLHVARADEAVLLGGARPAESYLAKEKIIEAACRSGCQAIHPGYGFLSENAAFADMVEKAGLTFIGPPAAVIAALGDKIAAKKLAFGAGVPTVPGHMQAVTASQEAAALAEKVGYPVLIKPAAGGGGKGMRVVDGPQELPSAMHLCQQEARKAFGDDRMFIERYVRKPRHVEIQVLADQYGNIVHLGERECSIQRRYQKIIEESPSTVLDESLRGRMGMTACNLARQAGYVNAGTVEFIVDENKEFYFLEMNTRLQVEHPVTEMVTGLDLVELQLRIADGEVLPFKQQDISPRGWAIEARTCAEDSSRGFIPSVGLITRYAAPRGEFVRVESGIHSGSYINVFYDSMVAKVITWGQDREEARKRLVQAVNGYHIEGVVTNVDFINQILTHPAFIRGELSTDFIRDHLEDENAKIEPPAEHLHFMTIATTLIYHLRKNLVKGSLLPLRSRVGTVPPSVGEQQYVVKSDGDIFHVRLHKEAVEFEWVIRVNDDEYHVKTPPMEFYRRRLKLKINDEVHHFRLRYAGNFIWAAFCGINRTFEIYNPREWDLARHMPPPVHKVLDNVLECPMPGLVVDVKVKPGDRVYRGQELVTIESMKMESAIASPCDGEVDSVLVKAGDEVETGKVMVSFK
ncbi:MAG: acetyl-CoA carboxylase biotin carboxylase subunit [Desulfobacterales bacterium]|nr:MAG: acetyl-CoA carboxylase biotin carboxylase subunit [Desulfobacterales bacterium]